MEYYFIKMLTLLMDSPILLCALDCASIKHHPFGHKKIFKIHNKHSDLENLASSLHWEIIFMPTTKPE